MNKKLTAYALLPAIVLTFAGTALTAHASSSEEKAKRPNPIASLVAAIALRFNLNTTDVQKVFDDQRAVMETKRKQTEADRLAKAVANGTLTQAQANLIVAKRAELVTFRASLEGKTQLEKMAALKTQAEALKKWATDNGIPYKYFSLGSIGMGVMGKGSMKAHHKMNLR